MLNFLNLGKNYKVAQVLLENKAKVDHQDKQGSTALHYAVYSGNMTNTLRLLYQTYNINSLFGLQDLKIA